MQVGLCLVCEHTRLVQTPRGSTFHRCARAEVDPRYAKYPRLPVMQCAGFQPCADATAAERLATEAEP